jgi:hypothetical protein
MLTVIKEYGRWENQVDKQIWTFFSLHNCSHFRVLQSASNNLDTSVKEITRADPRFFKVAKTGTGNTYFESLLYRGKIRMQYGV